MLSSFSIRVKALTIKEETDCVVWNCNISVCKSCFSQKNSTNHLLIHPSHYHRFEFGSWEQHLRTDSQTSQSQVALFREDCEAFPDWELQSLQGGTSVLKPLHSSDKCNTSPVCFWVRISGWTRKLDWVSLTSPIDNDFLQPLMKWSQFSYPFCIFCTIMLEPDLVLSIGPSWSTFL